MVPVMHNDLAGKIRELAGKGGLTHLSVMFYSGKWHVSVSTSRWIGTQHAEDVDPIKAMDQAMASAMKGAPNKKVTVAVTETIPPAEAEVEIKDFLLK